MSLQRSWGAWALLALILPFGAALAQKVVVLPFDGDAKDAVRGQVEKELGLRDDVQLISQHAYDKAAAKKGLKGPRAYTPQGVAKVAGELRLVVAVEGKVGHSDFKVRFLDARGQELWSKALPVVKKKISEKHAQKLAAAIAAAAATAKPAPKEKDEGDEEVAAKEKDKGKAKEKDEGSAEGEKQEGRAKEKDEGTTKEAAAEEKPKDTSKDTSAKSEEQKTLPKVEVADAKTESEQQRAERIKEEQAESHTDTSTDTVHDEDIDAEGGHKKVHPSGAPVQHLITLQVGGSTTWRWYCARPGVKDCQTFDALTAKPDGVAVDFLPKVPYMGFAVGLELFPFAGNSGVGGLGLVASYSRGFSLTSVSANADGVPTEVVSLDDAWAVMGTYRFHFVMNSLLGYAGLRGGLSARLFDVDPNARSPLPGSHRRYGEVGGEVSVPIISWLSVEGGAFLFLNPSPGVDELAGFGATASGNGFGAELGIAGDVWGPIGYRVRARYASYKDQYSGAGNLWKEGGAAEESYTTIFWGLTAHF